MITPQKISLFLLSVLFCCGYTQIARAQNYVPIVGADQAATRYSCKIIAGVGVVVEYSNGTAVETSSAAVSKKLNKQILGLKGKISTVNEALKRASTKQKGKLKLRKSTLTAQLKDIRYLLTQIKACKTGVLVLSASSPVLFSKTIPDPRPGYSGSLSGYLYGFLFSPPLGWSGSQFCASMSGVSKSPKYPPGFVYPEFTVVGPFLRDRGLSLGGVEIIFDDWPQGKLMIVLAQGIIGENAGSCPARPAECSITETQTVLQSFYGSALIHSLYPLVGSGYCS